jgi:hypothetical protein
MPRTKRKRQGRPTLLSRIATSQLVSELDRRRSMLGELRTQREELDAEIASLDGLAGETTVATQRKPGRPVGARRGRGGNKQSLPALLQSLLNGKTMSIPELTAAAKRAGHKSKSKNFRNVVSLAIITNRKLFKRVGRGQYTAK